MAAPILALGMPPTAANAAARTSAVSDANVTSVSCAPDGDCAAGGRFFDTSLGAQAFVLTETNGQWGAGVEVPGLAGLHPRTSKISAVSCTAGGCLAGGFYQDAAKRYHAIVTTDTNGQWSRAVTIFNGNTVPSPVTQVISLSCSGPGTCSAGGGEPAFVVNEVHGRWGQPHQFGAIGKAGHARVSCTSAGTCSAAWGRYVVSERNGRWGTPITVPGLGALGTKPAVASLSCPSAGSCAVGGAYQAVRGGREVFVASERNGHWGKATEIPGFTALNQEGYRVRRPLSERHLERRHADSRAGCPRSLQALRGQLGVLHAVRQVCRRRQLLDHCGQRGIRGRRAERHLGPGAGNPHRKLTALALTTARTGRSRSRVR